MSLLEQAKKILKENEYTCVAVGKDTVYTSRDHGIKPILSPLSEDLSFFEGKAVADKIIGKSAAMLLIEGKIAELYAEVISEAACAALEKHGIPYEYGIKTPYIINRDKTDMCPMEKSVLNIDDPAEAHQVLLLKVKEMVGKIQ